MQLRRSQNPKIVLVYVLHEEPSNESRITHTVQIMRCMMNLHCADLFWIIRRLSEGLPTRNQRPQLWANLLNLGSAHCLKAARLINQLLAWD